MSMLLFWAGVLLLFYTVAGYPLLVYIASSISRPRAAPQSNTPLPTVDIVLVTRNAEMWITQKLDSIFALHYPAGALHLIIVLDGSTDPTAEYIQRRKERHITLIDNSLKTTKAACLNQALTHCSSDIIIFTDVRQSLDPECVNALVGHFGDNTVGAVSGELCFKSVEPGTFSADLDAYWRYEKFLRYHESRIGSVPGVTGAIYAMRRKDYSPIPEQTLLDDVLIPMRLVLRGKRVLFDASARAYDLPSASQDQEALRKSRTMAGNWQLLTLCPALLNPFKNKIWGQFVSHKVLRLFSPLFLLAIFIGNLQLLEQSIFYSLTLVAQVAGYLVVMCGIIFPGSRKLRTIRVLHSGFMFIAYAASGFYKFATARHLALWK